MAFGGKTVPAFALALDAVAILSLFPCLVVFCCLQVTKFGRGCQVLLSICYNSAFGASRDSTVFSFVKFIFIIVIKL